MKRYEAVIIGAGPAGLSAAIEAAKSGMSVVVFDENARPGGQLFKQIHKFFGSKEHQAKIRGFKIGQNLLDKAQKAGVEVVLEATVLGIYEHNEVAVRTEGQVQNYKADAIVIATGASENMIPFKGWTLPGVMGAGAAQTLMNIQGIKPGKKILMVGSGNVGLVVSFQLIQAGCQVEAIIDALPRVGGFGVHASKVARTGVPFYMKHTVVEAKGKEKVEKAIIAEVNDRFQPITGTEKTLEVDTICIAVGLSPMSQLADNAGCEMVFAPAKGGWVPVLNQSKTSIPGIYCAGDVAGIEEASSAMIQGKICGSLISHELGYINEAKHTANVELYNQSLSSLRQGMFSPANKGRTDLAQTDEGYALSKSLLEKGYLTSEELKAFPAAKKPEGMFPVIECTQNIPCDPCQEVCPGKCIEVGSNITLLPKINPKNKCTGCALCVANCPGQAIFLIKELKEENCGIVALPYEFLPMPKKGAKGIALNRSGKKVCEAEVVEVRSAKTMDRTAIVFMKVPADQINEARFFKPAQEVC